MCGRVHTVFSPPPSECAGSACCRQGMRVAKLYTNKILHLLTGGTVRLTQFDLYDCGKGCFLLQCEATAVLIVCLVNSGSVLSIGVTWCVINAVGIHFSKMPYVVQPTMPLPSVSYIYIRIHILLFYFSKPE